MSSVQNDCPICMEVIELSKNCVTTECGHCFHANCLMTSVAHNGFGCPYCRTAMAQEVRKNEDDDDESEYEENEEEEDTEMFDDYILRGFRFFCNNIEGNVNHDDQDVVDEDNWIEAVERQRVGDNTAANPSVEFIAQNLVEQGVTVEQLVKILLRDHDEYDSHDQEFERIDDSIWGKIRILITNYNPAAAAVQNENEDDDGSISLSSEKSAEEEYRVIRDEYYEYDDGSLQRISYGSDGSRVFYPKVNTTPFHVSELD